MEERILKRLPGEDATFKIKISGTPKPSVEWNINGTVLVPNDRLIPQVENEFATLTLRKIVPEDGNNFVIRIQNEHGTVEETVSLIVISKKIIPAFNIISDCKVLPSFCFVEPPSPPKKPESVAASTDSLTIYWKPPTDDGDGEIIDYTLEFKTKDGKEYVYIRFIRRALVRDNNTT